MNERDSWTVDAMEKFGGSFVRTLGALARRADATNLRYIKTTWAETWARYEVIGKKLELEK